MRFLALLVFAAALAGCGEAAKTVSYVPPPPTSGGEMCVNECQEARHYCDEGCDLTRRSCTQKVQEQALQDYDKYTREQFDEQGDIDLYPHDFERLGPCNEARARCVDACENNYGACYKECGGTVDITTSCRFLCF